MDPLKILKFLPRIYKNYFIWIYHKREYNHLSKLFQNAQRTEILNKSIVFNTVRSFKNILDRELFIAKMLALNGASITVLLDDGILKHWDTTKVDRLRNIKDFRKVDYNLFPIYHRNLKNILNTFFARINLRRALRAYKDKNLSVIFYSKIIKKVEIENIEELKKYAKSSTIRFFKNSEVNFQENEVIFYYKISLLNALISRKIGTYILNEINPDAFITSHGIYSTWGPAFDYLKSKGTKAFVYAGKHSHSKDIHDMYFTDSKVQTLSRSELWKKNKDAKITPSMEEQVKDIFAARIKHSTKDTEIYYEGRTRKYIVDKKDGYKYHIAIFPNLIWDGNIKERHIAFNGIIDWLISTINHLKNNEEIKIYIKFHPAETTLFTGTPKIQDILSERVNLGDYKNLELISSEDKVDPYQFLLSGIDFAIVYDGILGLEIPYLKIPTLLAGVGGRFSVEGGNYTIKNKKEYFNYLDNLSIYISQFHENYEDYYRNIISYSYWYFFGNVIKLPTLSSKARYQTDLLQLSEKDMHLNNKILKIFRD